MLWTDILVICLAVSFFGIIIFNTSISTIITGIFSLLLMGLLILLAIGAEKLYNKLCKIAHCFSHKVFLSCKKTFHTTYQNHLKNFYFYENYFDNLVLNFLINIVVWGFASLFLIFIGLQFITMAIYWLLFFGCIFVIYYILKAFK